MEHGFLSGVSTLSTQSEPKKTLTFKITQDTFPLMKPHLRIPHFVLVQMQIMNFMWMNAGRKSWSNSTLPTDCIASPVVCCSNFLPKKSVVHVWHHCMELKFYVFEEWFGNLVGCREVVVQYSPLGIAHAWTWVPNLQKVCKIYAPLNPKCLRSQKIGCKPYSKIYYVEVIYVEVFYEFLCQMNNILPILGHTSFLKYTNIALFSCARTFHDLEYSKEYSWDPHNIWRHHGIF